MAGLFEKAMKMLGLDFEAQANREIDARQDALATDVAERYARGNVQIQDRQILTSEELDLEVEELCAIEFSRA
jgi:hypothetical protein